MQTDLADLVVQHGEEALEKAGEVGEHVDLRDAIEDRDPAEQELSNVRILQLELALHQEGEDREGGSK